MVHRYQKLKPQKMLESNQTHCGNAIVCKNVQILRCRVHETIPHTVVQGTNIFLIFLDIYIFFFHFSLLLVAPAAVPVGNIVVETNEHERKRII